MRQRNIRQKDFENSIKKKVMVGTYVGNNKYSKVIKFETRSLIFQYLVDEDGEILLPEITMKFYK